MKLEDRFVVNWKCEYCSLERYPLMLSTELEAFNHIVSQKHLEKMKFSAAIEDLQAWMDWVININPKIKIEAQAADPKEAPVPLPNVPRVPMLDEMPLNVEYISEMKNFYSYLIKYKRKFRFCDVTVLEKAKAMQVNWRCTFCKYPNSTIFIQFSEMMSAFNHIISHEHWKNMGVRASTEDLNYWSSWADSILKCKERPTNTVYQFHSRKGDVKVSWLRKNTPRVAMIDEIPENELAVSKEMFNAVLDETQSKFKNGKKSVCVSKQYITHWVCSFCSTSSKKVQLSNEMDTFLHIVKDAHRENMQYRACLSDLNYWKNWVDQLYFKLDIREPDQKPLQNGSRVPLLDKPTDMDLKLSESDFLTRYNAIRLQISHLKPCKTTEQKVSYTCNYCPGTPGISTIYELIKHVFDGRHHSYIQFSALLSDFTFYENLIEPAIPSEEGSEAQGKECAPTIPQKPFILTTRPAVSVGTIKTTPISVVNPVRTITSTVPPDCKLPLFSPFPSTRKPSDSTCPGPTNQQIEYVSKTQIREFIPHIQFFDTPAKCGFCGSNMSQWPLLHVASHVFSVGHLNKFKNSGALFYKEDFEWWITKLNSTTVLRVPSVPSQLTNCYLGGLKQIKTLDSGQDFGSLSSEERELIKNIDEAKLGVHKTMANIMFKFGCCIYCNIWFLKPIDIIHHFISDHHFANVKKHHPVKQTEVNEIMSIAKICQKDSLKCIIM